jgi:hypothetical protein
VILYLTLYALIALLVSLVGARLDPESTRPNEWGDVAIYPMAICWPLTLMVFGLASIANWWASLIRWYAPAALGGRDAE